MVDCFTLKWIYIINVCHYSLWNSCDSAIGHIDCMVIVVLNLSPLVAHLWQRRERWCWLIIFKVLLFVLLLLAFLALLHNTNWTCRWSGLACLAELSTNHQQTRQTAISGAPKVVLLLLYLWLRFADDQSTVNILKLGHFLCNLTDFLAPTVTIMMWV